MTGDTHHGSVSIEVETLDERGKLTISEDASSYEVVTSRSELRKLLVELYHEVGPNSSPPWEDDDDE